MRISERSISRLIVISPLLTVALVIATATYLYVKRIRETYSDEQSRYLKEYLSEQKVESENWVKQTIQLLEFSENNLVEDVKKELKSRVNLAYDTATYIQDKYNKLSHAVIIKRHISDSLKRMVWKGNQKNYIWITDYRGNNILSADENLDKRNIIDYKDADGRAIVLEEIQMVRKHKEGYINTRFNKKSGDQIMYVKDFGHYDWFFGSGMHIKQARAKLKKQQLNLIKSFPTDSLGFIAVFEGKKPIYLSKSAKDYFDKEVKKVLLQDSNESSQWHEFDKRHIMTYNEIFEPFGWNVVYGFDRSRFDANLIEDQKRLEVRIRLEMLRIGFGAFVIGIFSIIFSLLFSRHVAGVFKQYKAQVEEGERELQELNGSLEKRIEQAVIQFQEKDKMLIQQSKMAEMGDMISMIAHQWRQPLNQLSYIFMNIEGAYEYKELTPKYLNNKLGEGNKLLEFMSHTIDDFRNFFRPDKQQTLTSISDVVSKTLPLMEQILEEHGIALHVSYESDTKVALFRNELMQVILNLIKNAKDIVIEEDVTVPIIGIKTYEGDLFVGLEVCDNGGGIDEAIMDKIFIPYFSTKSKSQGTGLGLYMSKTIVEEHLNGILSVENTEEGACFKIMIQK
ncbi:MAG: cache domain-containing protein [Campylobacterota bacterium]|nr:cache domain-containing protein [Campylobacterota bacterium]